METQQAKAPASNSSGIAPVNRRLLTARPRQSNSTLSFFFFSFFFFFFNFCFCFVFSFFAFFAWVITCITLSFLLSKKKNFYRAVKKKIIIIKIKFIFRLVTFFIFFNHFLELANCQTKLMGLFFVGFL